MVTYLHHANGSTDPLARFEDYLDPNPQQKDFAPFWVATTRAYQNFQGPESRDSFWPKWTVMPLARVGIQGASCEGQGCRRRSLDPRCSRRLEERGVVFEAEGGGHLVSVVWSMSFLRQKLGCWVEFLDFNFLVDIQGFSQFHPPLALNFSRGSVSTWLEPTWVSPF